MNYACPTKMSGPKNDGQKKSGQKKSDQFSSDQKQSDQNEFTNGKQTDQTDQTDQNVLNRYLIIQKIRNEKLFNKYCEILLDMPLIYMIGP